MEIIRDSSLLGCYEFSTSLVGSHRGQSRTRVALGIHLSELQAYYRGESVTEWVMRRAARYLRLNVMSVEREDRIITILDKRGLVVEHKLNLATLRRHFKMIDSFFSDFEEASVIQLDCCAIEIYKALGPFSCKRMALNGMDLKTDVPLEECIRCIHILEPTDPLYYFYFSVDKMPTCELIDLVKLLPNKTMGNLLSNLRHIAACPLVGYDAALLAILKLKNAPQVGEMLADYPSYRWHLLPDSFSYDVFFTTAFDGGYYMWLPETIRRKIMRQYFCVEGSDRGRDAALLQAIGYSNSILDKEEKREVSLPFLVPPSNNGDFLHSLVAQFCRKYNLDYDLFISQE